MGSAEHSGDKVRGTARRGRQAGVKGNARSISRWARRQERSNEGQHSRATTESDQSPTFESEAR